MNQHEVPLNLRLNVSLTNNTDKITEHQNNPSNMQASNNAMRSSSQYYAHIPEFNLTQETQFPPLAGSHLTNNGACMKTLSKRHPAKTQVQVISIMLKPLEVNNMTSLLNI